MTGYGAGEAPLGAGTLTVEIRSVNHRYVDLRLNFPEELERMAFDVERLLRPRLQRGRFDVSARVTQGSAPTTFDRERAIALYHDLAELRDELAPNTELPLTVLAAVPDLFRAAPCWDRETLLASFEVASMRALAAVAVMREAEGEALTADIRARLAEARALRQALLAEVPAAVDAHRTRLRERIGKLLDTDMGLDPSRLEVELAVFADRSDVSEELSRLESHFAQLDTLLSSNEPVGRKIDFLLQEFMREANTLGSKSQATAIAHAVVELKTAIERMREQAQNLE